MQVIECWSVCVWDGGDRSNHAFYITSDKEKDKYLAENKYDSAYAQTIVIFDTLAEMEEHSTKKTRERALAKLTALERKALGV